MKLVQSLLCLAAGLATTGAASALHNIAPRADGSLASWLAAETLRALQGVLANLGPDGAGAQGATAGLLVASTSKADPNYFYSWTRDSALTFKCLVDQFLDGHAELEPRIQQYISAQASLQTVSNPSGALCAGGLGEPKFDVDGTAFTGAWGRPQRDGPALRATALIAYGRHLVAQGQTALAASNIWPIVSNDLSYVTQYWNQTGFDLWEEINSSSFFTTAAQYRALIEGSAFAQQVGQSCEHCDAQAPLVLCFLQSYWTGTYARANTGGGRSGKDANSLLASIHLFDPAAPCDARTFQPCSDKALANHKVITDAFRPVYALNAPIPAGQGVAVGRYPEDVYQGGNPWYLSNFAAAEQLYAAVAQWTRLGALSITPTSLAFFKDIYPAASPGTYAASTSTFAALLAAVTAYADSYLALAQRYTPTSGLLAEQFARDTGAPLSAANLTWSYAALLTAAQARANRPPASWGARAAALPATCAPGAATGPCAPPPTNLSWPGRPCAAPGTTAVTFNELKTTAYGETIYISGSVPALGAWDLARAVPLRADKYADAFPLWYATVALPAGEMVQYKYVRRSGDGSWTWESDPDRVYTVPAACSGASATNDVWR